MSEDSERVSIESCTFPGTINVSQQALDLAERFQTAVPSGYAVLVRKDVVDRHPKRTIDLDASGNPILK